MTRSSIGYAFRPGLRCRLTPGGRTLPGKPWDSGGRDSHPAFRYSCPHNRWRKVHRRSRARLRPVPPRSPTVPPRRRGPRIRSCVYSRSFSARGLSSSQLLRTVQMMAASKPTSYLSEKPHGLSDSTQVWDLIRRSWAVSLSTTELSPRCLTPGYPVRRSSEFDGLRHPGRGPRSISALHPREVLPDAAPKGISERTSYHPA